MAPTCLVMQQNWRSVWRSIRKLMCVAWRCPGPCPRWQDVVGLSCRAVATNGPREEPLLRSAPGIRPLPCAQPLIAMPPSHTTTASSSILTLGDPRLFQVWVLGRLAMIWASRKRIPQWLPTVLELSVSYLIEVNEANTQSYNESLLNIIRKSPTQTSAAQDPHTLAALSSRPAWNPRRHV